MIRSALPLCALAAPLVTLALAGCTTYYDPPPATPVTSATGAPVVASTGTPPAVAAPATPASASRSDYGIIESISLVNVPASAAAGGTQPAPASGPYRVTMRMENGNVQNMTVDNRAFLVGDRVQLMPDGRLIRR